MSATDDIGNSITAKKDVCNSIINKYSALRLECMEHLIVVMNLFRD